jgi:hypothetical protein
MYTVEVVWSKFHIKSNYSNIHKIIVVRCPCIATVLYIIYVVLFKWDICSNTLKTFTAIKIN